MTSQRPTSSTGGRPPRPVTSHDLFKAFVDAGIFRPGDHVRQFVIVARDWDRVRIFVEHYGDERMLKITQTLAGIMVENVVAPPDDEGFLESNPDNERESG